MQGGDLPGQLCPWLKYNGIFGIPEREPRGTTFLKFSYDFQIVIYQFFTELFFLTGVVVPWKIYTSDHNLFLP